MSGYRLFKYAESPHGDTVAAGTSAHTEHGSSHCACRMVLVQTRSPRYPGLRNRIPQSALSNGTSACASPSTMLTKPRHPGLFPYTDRLPGTTAHLTILRDLSRMSHWTGRKEEDTQFSVGVLDRYIVFNHHMERMTGNLASTGFVGHLHDFRSKQGWP
jgi:hypothetical protein